MVSAIIVAAGKGIRMDDNVRKQYLLLDNRPLISHTIEVFDECSIIDEIFLVVPEEDFVESMVLSYIVPGEKKPKIKRVGKIHDGSNFDENTLNYYMREAFGELDLKKG